MSGIVFQRTEERIQIISQPRTYRILTGGQGPAGSNTDGVQSSNNSVTDIVALTQAAYDALPVKDSTTFYIIKADA